MSYSRPSCNRSSTNFAATRCGAGISDSLTKRLQRTPYHSSTAQTHGASPSKKRLTTLPSISSHPGVMVIAAFAKSYWRYDDHTRAAAAFRLRGRVANRRSLPSKARSFVITPLSFAARFPALRLLHDTPPHSPLFGHRTFRH